MSKVVVTGMGIITALGDTPEANRAALVHGRNGIGRGRHFESAYTHTLPFGEVGYSTAALRNRLGIAGGGITRTDLLALHAANSAIAGSGLGREQLASPRTALIGASTVGGMCLTDEMYADANDTTGRASPYLSAYSNSANTCFLQQQYGIGGIVNTFNTACSSSANSIMYGARLIKNGLADCVIAGGVDSLSKFTVNGFNALMILSNEPCRPFDRDRKGLNLGEGAAFLVLEKESSAKGKKIYAEVKGYGNSSDAYHPSSTSPDGDGPYWCMQRALQSASLQPAQIGCINAHGTATENNDETESIAMQRIFGQQVPPFTSTKSYTGHTLGAAGAVAAVYSIFNLQYDELYPSLRFEHPIPGTGLVPVTAYRRQPLQYVMSNSFGFGGNCSSVIFGKP